MTITAQDSIKYQGIAPKSVINAVAKAASKTGVDFSFLMEKASVESSFDPSAKSGKSSATGLFQFIESTWLSMIKEHGAKYGLGTLAQQIEMKDGKPCIENCAVKNQILNLRKNPEISALMAGEYSAENKVYLERQTGKDAGSTELYLAHFLGPASAAKFLNCYACEPDTAAAKLFPQAAHVNKNVFYDQTTGKPRTLDEIYTLFSSKFDDTIGGVSPSSLSAASPPPSSSADDRASALAPAPAALSSLQASAAGQALFFSKGDGIVWNDDPRYQILSGAASGHRLSPASILALAEDKLPASGFGRHQDRHGYNA